MILHIDMDAFYASVEQRDQPELVGQPVVVGGTPQGRGVVAAASYEARKFGIHSAMPASTAKRLCPRAVFLPSRIGYYAEISKQIRDIFSRFTPTVEPLSLDEAFLDVSGTEQLFGPPDEVGRQIQRDIQDELHLPASVGIAPNKFLAKIASDLEKPNGFVTVDSQGILEFLAPLPIGRLWGVGKVSRQVFEKLGVRTIGELRRLDVKFLTDRFGKQGEHLWRLARGIDDRAVVPDHLAKSISHETTFAADINDRETLRAWLLELTEQVARRLRRQKLRGKTVHLKVRFSDFRTITRSHTLPEPTDVTEELWQTAVEMFTSRLPEPLSPVRLLGMGVGGFERTGRVQKTLFDDTENDRQRRLDATRDAITDRFGKSALSRGTGIDDLPG